MNIVNDHRSHLAIVALALALALWFGWGIGIVAAIAILGCVAMFGAVMWLVASDARRRNHKQDLQNH